MGTEEQHVHEDIDVQDGSLLSLPSSLSLLLFETSNIEGGFV